MISPYLPHLPRSHDFTISPSLTPVSYSHLIFLTYPSLMFSSYLPHLFQSHVLILSSSLIPVSCSYLIFLTYPSIMSHTPVSYSHLIFLTYPSLMFSSYLPHLPQIYTDISYQVQHDNQKTLTLVDKAFWDGSGTGCVTDLSSRLPPPEDAGQSISAAHCPAEKRLLTMHSVLRPFTGEREAIAEAQQAGSCVSLALTPLTSAFPAVRF
ncbi:hypothetical protein RRG08_004570 [Elysia crispata]|uniref:Uncharacterized protein n=1 Tax=Elysia crispata TaxID=231223 RepID=A0AAE1AKV1_9GAST|nr:hypothetical protein RRG08_004570 [Elysia crispata]